MGETNREESRYGAGQQEKDVGDSCRKEGKGDGACAAQIRIDGLHAEKDDRIYQRQNDLTAEKSADIYRCDKGHSLQPCVGIVSAEMSEAKEP
ncbi:hypothetical protein RBB78_12590 [Tunturiibacter empetritectus]|uniref:hypothetical protein n=1 Tax=Tunturiibacter empetritectus TaxID=3069691 RepID=UPI003D9B8B1A